MKTLVLFALLAGVSSFGAITGPLAHDKCQTPNGSTFTCTTPSLATTGGTFFAAIVSISNSGANQDPSTATITDFCSATPTGNIWRALTPQIGAGAPSTVIWRSYDSASGPLVVCAVHTFTVAMAVVSSSIAVSAWAGTSGDPFDGHQNKGTAASVTSVASGSITPAETGALVISGSAARTATWTGTPSSPLTVLDTANWASGCCIGVGSAYQIQTTATAVSNTWTISGTGSMSAVIASFKPAVTSGTVRHRSYGQ